MRSLVTPLAVPPQGPPGATSKGFGSVDYSDLDEGTPLGLVGDTWTRIIRNLSPANNPNPPIGPWAGFAFWSNNLLRAKALGDTYLFKFSYRIIPALRGSSIRFAVRPGGDATFDFGPQPVVLAAQAGGVEVGSITFSQTARSRFVASGAEVYLMSSSGGSLIEFSPEVTPLGYL
jgi:hypothetical protein